LRQYPRGWAIVGLERIGFFSAGGNGSAVWRREHGENYSWGSEVFLIYYDSSSNRAFPKNYLKRLAKFTDLATL